MLQFRLIPVFTLFMFVSASGIAAKGPLEFHGEVSRGETVIHRFEFLEVTYEFRLVPAGGGWTIWIGNPEHRDHNFVAVVTPPYRGINPATIEGWHFRNSDNTGPNDPGGNHVNAPQEERHFAFVRNETAFFEAQEAVEILLSPNNRPESDLDEAELRLNMVPRVEGTLRIDALELGNLVPGGKAYIERMAFRVRLQLP